MLAVRRLGSGPEVLLVHGGLGPDATWSSQLPLATRWTLIIPSRRGYGDSPPAGSQDFEVDADDLIPLLQHRAHLVGFSWGGLGALIAACERPELVRSLTIIEAPLYSIARGDPEVDRLEELSAEFLNDGMEARREVLADFLALAGLARTVSDPLPIELRDVIQRAQGSRLPGEAKPELGTIATACIPALVMSGGHAPGLEKICDCLAEKIGAQRAILPGRGHAIPRADGFNELLEAFLMNAENRSPDGHRGAA